jgi:hypothetical protein
MTVRSSAVQAADFVAAVLARRGRPLSVRGRNTSPRKRFASAEELVNEHFAKRLDLVHINQPSMLHAIELLEERPSVILETGSSGWGTNSSRLFDDYVAAFGGEFATADIRLASLLRLWRDLCPQSVVVCDDSVRFLRRWVERRFAMAPCSSATIRPRLSTSFPNRREPPLDASA